MSGADVKLKVTQLKRSHQNKSKKTLLVQKTLLLANLTWDVNFIRNVSR